MQGRKLYPTVKKIVYRRTASDYRDIASRGNRHARVLPGLTTSRTEVDSPYDAGTKKLLPYSGVKICALSGPIPRTPLSFLSRSPKQDPSEASYPDPISTLRASYTPHRLRSKRHRDYTRYNPTTTSRSTLGSPNLYIPYIYIIPETRPTRDRLLTMVPPLCPPPMPVSSICSPSALPCSLAALPCSLIAPSCSPMPPVSHFLLFS